MCNGFHFRRESLKIKAFYIHFSSQSHPPLAAAATLPLQKEALLHDFLTLRFLPRMIHDPLEIDGSLIQAGTGTGGGGGRGPAFLTLHKLMSSSPESVSVIDNPTHVYGSRDHVKASEGVRFEIYNGDAKVLKGSIRKDEEGNWKLDCKRGGGLDNIDGVLELDYGKEAYVEVAVDVDGQVEFLNDTVKMMMYQAARRRVIRRNLQTRLRPISGLEEIPEESAEEELEIESDGSCCCDCDSCGTKQEEEEMEMEGEDCEMEMEIENGSSWAVDAAILVVSLGVGYLVSRASAKKLVRYWR